MRWPAIALPSTAGGAVDLSRLAGRSVVYVYPLTGRPARPTPEGWEAIPGARGCTPQSCAFQIGRASCRERVCQYESISVVAVSLKKKNANAQHNSSSHAK